MKRKTHNEEKMLPSVAGYDTNYYTYRIVRCIVRCISRDFQTLIWSLKTYLGLIIIIIIKTHNEPKTS